MIIESMIAMTLLTADNHRGDLNIEIDQEDKENVNKDIKEYDTTLFDKDSKSINDAIKQQQKNKDEKVKNNLFQNQASHTTRLDETKHVLFSHKSSNIAVESDKSPYIQDKQKRNIFPYILLSIGVLLTLGFVIFSIRRGRRSKQ
ncbi:type VII secretion protein EssA [Staphylococcus caprae]|uniref:type VII secretion protein EssA n=1 Tax=Staphylococcus caprae TaxID=29380 RepID=UPI003B21E67B